MTTTKSYSSSSRFLGFYKNALKRFGGLGVFFGALTAVFFPLQYILTLVQHRGIEEYTYRFVGVASTYNGFSAVLFTGLQLVIPMIFAVNIYSYMHSKQAVDVFHSLPISRTEMFAANFAAGMTIIAASLVLNFTVVWASSAMYFGIAQSMVIWVELLVWLAITFSIFAITAFAMVNVGTIFDGVAFSFALLGGFAAIYGLVLAILNMFVYGFAEITLPLRHMIKFSPVSVMIERIALNPAYTKQSDITNNLWMVLAWFVIALAVTVLSVKMYQRRRSEMAQTVGNIGPVQILVRAEAVFAGAIVLAMMFVSVFNFNDRISFALASIVGAFISYAVMELVFSRNVSKVFKTLNIAAVSAFVAGGVIFFISSGPFGFENKVPDIKNVSSVRINYLGLYGSQEKYEMDQGEWIYNGVTLEKPEAIQLVLDTHKVQVKSRPDKNYRQNEVIYDPEQPSENLNFNTTINIQYNLKNGKKMYRSYYPVAGSNLDNLLKLTADDELITKSNPLFSIDIDTINVMELKPLIYGVENTHKFSKQEHQGLVNAIKLDLLSLNPQKVATGKKGLGYVQYQFNIPRELPVTVAVAEENGARYDQKPTYGEDYIRTISNYVLLTEDFTHTLKYLEALGVKKSLDIDLSKVKSVQLSEGRYRYYGSGVLTSMSPSELQDTYFEATAKYEDKSRGVISIDNPKAFLAEMESDLVHISINQSYVGVWVELENDTWTFYLLEFNKLPAVYKQAFSEAVYKYYG